jgi:superfamily II DNA or RNA helicase
MEHPDYDGAVVTYAQVAREPLFHRMACGKKRTLVIFDEIHHAGDQASWGAAILEAFEPAQRRLMMTGTLFRPRPDQTIPFVEYPEPDRIAKAHHNYNYGQAIAEGVCRRTEFIAYDGEARWLDADTSELSARLSGELDDEDRAIALSSAYRPDGPYMRDMITAAHDRLVEQRDEVPDAGGLLVASDQDLARAYASLVRRVTGTDPMLVISDEPEAQERIEAYRSGRQHWLVAVAMVSEGVDIPRLCVGVWATKVRTELFFRQVVGRFARRRPNETHNAALFLPAEPHLIGLAQKVEGEMAEALREAEEELLRERGEREPLRLNTRVPLLPGGAELDQIIRSGVSYGADEVIEAEAACRRHQMPTFYAPNIIELLRERGGTLGPTQTIEVVATPDPAAEPLYHARQLKRSELVKLTNIYAQRSGKPHKQANAEIAQAIGAYRNEASLEQLEHGLALVKSWLAEL